ncbi:hypothetical protein ACFU7Y_31205 [Kitasatospora sp. NPDC057542]|uniref:hypothetical protein n=1 Tax=Streptomycetaceae TaxID=2062 RepID=UPI001CCC06DB|nr:hypothetical protein [Streptomyces sp. LS1784]
MGIFDRLFHRPPHEPAGQEAAQRAALAHDEAADAYGDEVERTRETQERLAQEEADRRAAENMTAEGDPWD